MKSKVWNRGSHNVYTLTDLGGKMISRNIVKLFESRKSHLDYRLQKDYISNGIATLPCCISEYNDVISAYSVKDYETLNPEFADYLKSVAEVTPPECPIVLNIISECLSSEQQKVIKEIIQDHFAYELGIVEKDELRHTRIFCGMFFGMIILVILLWQMQINSEEPFELFFIFFYFLGDTLCDYIFVTGHDLRRDRRLAGRLASIKIVFSKSYKAPDYTESDVEKLYSEIKKDVNKTIDEEEYKADMQ